MAPSEQTPSHVSLGYLEDLYIAFLRDPDSVPADWRRYFASLPAGDPFAARPQAGPGFKPGSLFSPSGNGAPAASDGALQERVDQLIRAYRVRGHIIARLDPLGLPRTAPQELEPAFHGLSDADADRPFSMLGLRGTEVLTLRQILERLRNTYCRNIGVQFMHIDDLAVRHWLQLRMESTENRIQLSSEVQRRILTRLTDAVIFEDFVQKKYLGAKSFSLEGCESLIPLLELAIEKAGAQEIAEIVLAMAHRGRLNVLANIMGKNPRDIFREFEDADPELSRHRGDVKYHLGHSNNWKTSGGRTVHLSLCFNPSHLEFVNPVALGRLRAKQDRVGDTARVRGMALLIHGDAAFCGEGVTQETLNLSQLDAYRIGGAIHVVVNNQIGFTTPPQEGRSSVYATSVARMLQSPIFHVNGEDPEAVAQVIDLSMEFRSRFRRDVVIDMYGYRRRGHNEGDEPSFTQPILYRAIEKRVPVREGYLEHLLKLGGITREEADEIAVKRRQHLEKELSAARSEEFVRPADRLEDAWKQYSGGPDADTPEVATAVPRQKLRDWLERLTQLPDDFTAHPKIRRWLDLRAEMAEGKRPLDWAAAEALALASLAVEGRRVRLTGQDSARGTFSHRHAVLHDVENGSTYAPLQHLAEQQAPVEIHNSPLSEVGVLGYEYGYSLDYPEALVGWEAQFGDFCNAAQVIIDQFIASAENKWRRLSGLVLLLPHGFEGMGPEHSSARLERFLSLAAEDNMQVVNLTTPAQFFHCLRRQVLRPWRKPLVVMTPKSLLRLPEAVSSLAELSEGGFQRVIPDPAEGGTCKRIVLCCGKIYYELKQQREEAGRRDVALVRVEQLYPFPVEALKSDLQRYGSKTPVCWVQEEPENMGAWPMLRMMFCDRLFGRPFSGISRPPSASPATGSSSSHRLEQAEILRRALDVTA